MLHLRYPPYAPGNIQNPKFKDRFFLGLSKNGEGNIIWQQPEVKHEDRQKLVRERFSVF